MNWLVKGIQWVVENFDKVMKIGIPMIAFFLIVSWIPDITNRIRRFKQALLEAKTPLGFIVLVIGLLIFYYIYEWYKGQLI